MVTLAESRQQQAVKEAQHRDTRDSLERLWEAIQESLREHPYQFVPDPERPAWMR